MPSDDFDADESTDCRFTAYVKRAHGALLGQHRPMLQNLTAECSLQFSVLIQ